ncbi:MAG: 2-dehydro-3-deoxygalactonokinase [Alphaproteobacteria bacterium]|nr:2-dehydro-3-deoxygalactonokinase [Alphaproteobacteria bacterium]
MKDRLALVGFEWAGPQLRAWAFDNEGEILSSFQVRDEPVSGHADWPGRIRFHLMEWLGAPPGVPVIGCGDVSAALLGAGSPQLIVPLTLTHLANHLGNIGGIHLVPWIGQQNPPDLTCGAETLLLGLGDAIGSVCVAG